MSKWRTRMKREKIEKNTAQFVLGIKYADGSKVELDGHIHRDTVKGVLDVLMAHAKIDKVKPA